MMTDTLRAPATSLEYFSLLVAEEKEVPVGEALANIAQIEYPGLNLQDIADEFDQLIARMRRKIPAETPILQKIWRLNQLLYQTLQFSAPSASQDDPDLLCINIALKTRRSATAVLAVIYMELASALGLCVRCITFPDHPLIKIRLQRPDGTPGEVIIDPDNGKSLSMEDIRALLSPYKIQHGLVDDFDIPSDLFLEAASRKDIIGNVLASLRDIYLAQEDWPHLTEALDRLIMLNPEHIEHYRERGFALIKQGHPQQAAIDLEHYVQHARLQLASDVDSILQQLQLLRNPH